ncbi:hypothetical protein M3Y99_00742000 [Aphelenchoides fujianensis]|nr:hypothetical protein M3Y99_00741300 [Aphelenchoides fujianensis]KAI6234907.1 hypothetical protein M3Y99_00742000 [Aphelenchoides fujianensis]
MSIKLAFFFLACLCVWPASTRSTSVRRTSAHDRLQRAFKKERIVPDVLSYAVCIPSQQLHVSYGKKAVRLGTKFTLAEVKGEPTVTWKAEKNALYTLVKVDPDAPSPANPTAGQLRHWAVVNIPGNNLKRGQVATSYWGAGAPPKTGFHRYVFLLYRQPARLHGVQLGSEHDDRVKWNVEKFAHEHNLGRAVAGNFYLAQSDEQ